MSRSQSDASDGGWLRIAHHGSALLGSHVYIDGGEVALPGRGGLGRVLRANGRTYSIDLSESWSTSSIPFKSIKEAESPTVAREPGVDSANALYSFGGDSSWRAPVNKTTFPNRFQTFNPDGSGGGRWSSDLGRTDENVPDDIIPPVGGYISQTQGTGIYLGGYEPFASVAKTRYERPSDAVALPGIVTFDFENRTWTNDTIAPYAPGGSVGYGAMHYVPNLGPAGLLAIFGGESETAGAPSERLMDDITMYEREGKTWHHQIANGFVLPRYRKGMCAVGVQEDGQGSYEIFIYGGYAGSFGPEQSGYDEIWIPAFQWFKVYEAASISRFGHTCHTVGNRYMMTIGGINAALTGEKMWGGGDTTVRGIAFYDVTELAWTNTFSPRAPRYNRPAVVRNWYEENGRYPERWDQPALRDLILDSEPRSSDSADPLPSSPETQSTSSTKSPGPIIRGVLGGLAFVALLVLAFIFLHARRRRHRRGAHDAYVDEKIPHDGEETSKHDGDAVNGYHVPEPCELEQGPYMSELPESEVAEKCKDDSPVGREPIVELPADTATRSS